jgi:hypothetical protein
MPGDSSVTLTWNSTEAATYAVKYSTDLENWDFDLDDGIIGEVGETTSATFDLSEFGIENETKLFFRVEEQ